MFLDQYLQALLVLVIEDRRSPAACLILEAFQALRIPGLEPAGYRVTGDRQDLADLLNRVALVAEEDAMSTPAQRGFFSVPVSFHQSLLLSLSERGHKAVSHAHVLVLWKTRRPLCTKTYVLSLNTCYCQSELGIIS